MGRRTTAGFIASESEFVYFFLHTYASLTYAIMFITFEGLDFSGKSTQVELLAERLRREHYRVSVQRDPGGTQIGEKIRKILLDNGSAGMADATELFLFSASRAQLVYEVIKPALASGAIVICDRFYDSTTAYQGWGRGLPVDAIKAINRTAAQGLVPDLTCFIDIPVDEVERRMKRYSSCADRMESIGREFYERTRAGYLALAEQERRFTVLNGLKPVEEVHSQIWHRVQETLIALTSHKTH